MVEGMVSTYRHESNQAGHVERQTSHHSLLGMPSLFSERLKIILSLTWFLTKVILAEDNHCLAMSS